MHFVLTQIFLELDTLLGNEAANIVAKFIWLDTFAVQYMDR